MMGTIILLAIMLGAVMASFAEWLGQWVIFCLVRHADDHARFRSSINAEGKINAR